MTAIPNLQAVSIAVVGNINIDIKTTVMPSSTAVFDDGETAVGEFYQSIGGGAANVAVAAAQLGASVWFCGAVGVDDAGDRLESALNDFHVTASLIRKVGAATGTSINLNWDNHNRHFLSCLPSAALLSADDVDVNRLAAAGCRHFYRGDIWFADRLLGDGNEAIFRQARKCGMTTYVDVNWDPAWSHRGDVEPMRERIRRAFSMLPFIDFVHGNERELSLFTGQEGYRSAAASLIDGGAGAVVVHRGREGSAVLDCHGLWTVAPATAIDRVVCETGTGDVFSAAFMVASSMPTEDRLIASNRIAAAHIMGVQNLIPRLA